MVERRSHKPKTRVQFPHPLPEIQDLTFRSIIDMKIAITILVFTLVLAILGVSWWWLVGGFGLIGTILIVSAARYSCRRD